jgi:hypothetical protein
MAMTTNNTQESIQIPEDGWVEIAKLTGEDADAEVTIEAPVTLSDDGTEIHSFGENNGEPISAEVLMADGKPIRLSVSNWHYDGDFAETAFAEYFPEFQVDENWSGDGDCVVTTVSALEAD